MKRTRWLPFLIIIITGLASSASVPMPPAEFGEEAAPSFTTPAYAEPLSFHLVDINEVYSNADGTLQYVELKALASFQTELQFTRITSLNASGGGEAVVFDFTARFPGWQQNETILLATRAFESVAGFAPDFVIPDGSITRRNGRVLFKQDTGSIVDAVAYGAFTGNNSGNGSPAPALPGDGLNSLTRVSSSSNNATAFAVAVNTPTRRDRRSAVIQGGGFMFALLTGTDEIIRFELATGNITQRGPAGFDVNTASGIEIGTAPGVNGGNPFIIVTQVDQDLVRLYDARTLMEMGSFAKGANDIGWSDVAFDGTNWIFAVSAGVAGDETFRGADLIDLAMSVTTGQVVKLGSINLNTPDGMFDVFGGIGFARPGVALVAGRTGGNRSLAQILINNNDLTRGPTLTTEMDNDGEQPGVSGQLVNVNAGRVLVSVPGSADLRIIDPQTGQQVGTLKINGPDFTDAPEEAITGLSRETVSGAQQ